jgi:hypothetical protein
VLVLAVLGSPVPVRAADPAAGASRRAGASPSSGRLAALPSPPGPGEIRLKVLGRSLKEVAGTIPAQFQLYRAGAPLFQGVPWVRGGVTNSPLRGTSGELAYAEGEYFYLRGLEPGIYDLHFARVGGNPPFRPVHVDGIVVEAGKIVQLPDLLMELGETLVEIGTPAVLPAPATYVVDRLNALLAQVAALEQVSESLRSENAALRRRVEALEGREARR